MTHNKTISTHRPFAQIILISNLYFYLNLTLLILSIIAFIISLTYWILIKKFRHFKNYVFLNIILNNVVKSMLVVLLQSGKVLYLYIHKYFTLTVNGWLLVMCYLIYKDLVKVFDGDMERKYLKTNLFVWGLSFAFALFVNLAVILMSENKVFPIHVAMLFLPLLINLFIYICVLYSLFKSEVGNRSDWCRRLLISTIIFFVSGMLFLPSLLRVLLYSDAYSYDKDTWALIILVVLSHAQAVAVIVYFFVERMNLTVWSEYYSSRNNREEIIMT